jgi:hypothetical protein
MTGGVRASSSPPFTPFPTFTGTGSQFSTPSPSFTSLANVAVVAPAAAPNNTIAIIGVAGGVSIAALLAIAAVAAAFRQRGGRKRSLSASPDTFTQMPGTHPNFINVVNQQDPNDYRVAAANPVIVPRTFALPPPVEKAVYNPFQARASPMSAAPPPTEETTRQAFAPQQTARALPSITFMNSARKLTKFAPPPPPIPPPPADDEGRPPPYP